MKPNRLSLGLAVGLASGTALVVGLRGHSAPVALPVASPSLLDAGAATPKIDETLALAPPPPAARGDRAPGCSFAAGDELTYRMTVTSDATVDPAKLGGPVAHASSGPSAMSQHTALSLDLRALSVPPSGGAILLARYRDVNASTPGAAADLAAPFLLDVNARCKIVRFARLDATPTAAARTEQALAHELQWTWPEATTTVDDGENAFGPLRARYVYGEDAGGAMVQRRVLQYPRLGAQGASPAFSLMTVRVGAGHWFESLRAQEKLAGVATADTLTRTEATRTDTPPGAFDGLPTEQGRYVWGDLLDTPVAAGPAVASFAPPTARQLASRAVAARSTLPAETRAFVDRVQSGANIARTWPALTTFLEAHPETTHAFVESMRAGAIPPAAMPAAFVALGKARTTESREELLAVMNNAGAPSIERTRSMFALVDRPDVDVSVARTLLGNVHDIATGPNKDARFFARESALAIGTMAGLRKEPAVTELAVQAAKEVLGQGHGAAALRPGFSTVANIGDPVHLSLVEPYLKNADPEVRRAATVSIRRMSPESTGDFAARWLAQESDANVKRELYMVIDRQTHDARTPATDAVVTRAIADLATHPDLITRKAIIRILGLAAPKNAAARTALARQIPFEQHERSDLYGVIAKYLSAEDIRSSLGM